MSQENVEVVRGVRYRVSIPSARSAERRTLDERLFQARRLVLGAALNALHRCVQNRRPFSPSLFQR
jgi:hypothetical protein